MVASSAATGLQIRLMSGGGQNRADAVVGGTSIQKRVESGHRSDGDGGGGDVRMMMTMRDCVDALTIRPATAASHDWRRSFSFERRRRVLFEVVPRRREKSDAAAGPTAPPQRQKQLVAVWPSELSRQSVPSVRPSGRTCNL